LVNSRLRDDAELFHELRHLKEKEKAILEETATVTTEEDDDDRRYLFLGRCTSQL
jgi:hypothetical protein